MTAEPRQIGSSDVNRSWLTEALRSPLSFLLLALLALYAPIFWGQGVFFRDPATWTYPARLFVREAWLAGDSFAWNPLQAFGFNVWSNPLYGILYPPHWLFLAVPRGFVGPLVVWQSVAHAFLGGAGVIVLLRRFGVSGSAALVGGLAWSVSGYTTAMWTAGLLLHADAWAPWIAVTFVDLARAHDARGAVRVRRALVAACALGMSFLLGEVFLAVIGLCFGLATAVADARARAPSWRDTAGRILRWAPFGVLAVILAGGLAAGTVLPTVAAAEGTERGRPLSAEVAGACSVHPARVFEFVAPGCFGDPYGAFPGKTIIGEPSVYGYPLAMGMYLGASVIALVLLGLGRLERRTIAFGALAVLALLIAFGKYNPVPFYRALGAVVPLLGRMRYPEKYMVLVLGWLALLAGFGAARVLRGNVRWARMAVVLIPLVAVAVAAPWLFSPELAPSMRAGALAGIAGVTGVVICCALVRSRPRAAAILLPLVVFVDLAAAATSLLDFGPVAEVTREPPAATLVKAKRRDPRVPPRVYHADAADVSAAEAVPLQHSVHTQIRAGLNLVPALGTTHGLGIMPGYDAAIPPSAAATYGGGARRGLITLRVTGTEFAVLALGPGGFDPPIRRATLEPLADPTPGSRLYRVLDPLPRAYVAGRVEPLGARSLEEMFQESVASGAVAFVEGDTAEAAGEAGRAGTCAIVHYANTRVSASCHAVRPAMAVFLEQYDRGWRATVDGAPVPIARVNGTFRGIAIAAGDHRIEMSFEPKGARLGVLVTLVTALVGLGLMVVFRPRRSFTA